MRALWAMFGRPSAAQRPGYVVSPYTNADLERT
jgi:hypothetical protein